MCPKHHDFEALKSNETSLHQLPVCPPIPFLRDEDSTFIEKGERDRETLRQAAKFSQMLDDALDSFDDWQLFGDDSGAIQAARRQEFLRLLPKDPYSVMTLQQLSDYISFAKRSAKERFPVPTQPEKSH